MCEKNYRQKNQEKGKIFKVMRTSPKVKVAVLRNKLFETYYDENSSVRKVVRPKRGTE